MMETKLEVGGMTCGGCARAVATTLHGIRGVCDARVDLATRVATVLHGAADAPADPDALARAVVAAGFTARAL